MNKKCQNCRYFEFGKCYNSEVVEMINTDDCERLIDLVEQGHISDMIEEHPHFTLIGDELINDLYTLGYIKKNKKVLNSVHDIDKDFIINYDDDVKLFVETILLEVAKLNTKKRYIDVSKDFGCKFWD